MLVQHVSQVILGLHFCNLRGRWNEEATTGVGVDEDAVELVLVDDADLVVVELTSVSVAEVFSTASGDRSKGLYTNFERHDGLDTLSNLRPQSQL
jgi:hypothetical protein